MRKITDIVDFNPKRYVKKGITAPFIDMASIPVDSRDVADIAEREFKGSGSKFKNGDTLFARITPCLENGKTAKVSGLKEGICAHGSTEFIVMAAKEADYDEDFVYYLARLPEFRAFAVSRMEGTSGRQRVPWQALADFEFNFPEKVERRKVGTFLKLLDDKIAINHQINKTLKDWIKSLYVSWFINFEPVKAKIDALKVGEDPDIAAMGAISGKTVTCLEKLKTEDIDAYKKLYDTARVFPQEEHETELGMIPHGWKVQKVGDVASEIRRGVSPKYIEGEGVLVLNQKCVRNNIIDFSLARRHNDKIKSIKGRELRIGDILINSTGVGTLGRLSPIRFLPEVTVVDSHITVVRADNKEINSSYLYSYLQTKEAFIEASGAGSTGQTELRRQVIEDLDIVTPEEKVLGAFDAIYSPISDLIAENEMQQLTLSNLRDTLLPKLLTGEINPSNLITD